MFTDYISYLKPEVVFGVVVALAAIFSMTTSLAALRIAKGSAEPNIKTESQKSQEDANWFAVGSVEELGRKIHAGVTLLNAESKNNFWTERQRANFSTAASYVQAAEDLVLRHK